MNNAETRAGQLHQTRWGLTNKLLERGADVNPEQVVRELGINVLRIRSDIAYTIKTDGELGPFFEKSHALALSILCALSVCNTKNDPNFSLPGVRVELTTFKPEEFNPFSTNRVEIIIPHPYRPGTISLKTGLDNLVYNLAMEIDDFSDTHQAAAKLVKDAGAERIQESEDDFIYRRTFEAARLSDREREIRNQDRSESNRKQIQMLLELKNEFCMDLIEIWLKRRNCDSKEAYDTDLTIKLSPNKSGFGDMLDIAAIQRDHKRVGFVTRPPSDFRKQTPRANELIAALKIVSFD